MMRNTAAINGDAIICHLCHCCCWWYQVLSGAQKNRIVLLWWLVSSNVVLVCWTSHFCYRFLPSKLATFSPARVLTFLTWKLVERRHSFGKEYNQRTMKTWRLGKGLQLNGREVGTALPPLVVGPCCPFTIAPSPVSLQPRFSFTTMEASLSPKIDAGSLLKISLVGGTHLLLHLLVVYPTWAKHCQLPMEGS